MDTPPSPPPSQAPSPSSTLDTSNAPKDIKSPCIRHCCLDNHDICVGCYRTLEDILGWVKSSDEEKRCILEACKRRRAERR